MKTILSCILCLNSCFSHAQLQSGITFFQGSWQQVMDEAKKLNKPVFTDCYTTWCGPCKYMDKNIFPLKEVGDYYNAGFVCYKLDMEKGEGPEIAKRYAVRNYPTYLFLDAAGEILHRAVGSSDAGTFIGHGKTALDPEANMKAMKKSYEAGRRDPGFMYRYAVALFDARMDFEQVAAEYLSAQPEDSLITPSNWGAMGRFTQDIRTRELRYILKNRSRFVELFGEVAVTTKLLNTASSTISRAAAGKDTLLFIAASAIMDSLDLNRVDGYTYYLHVLNLLEYHFAMGKLPVYEAAANNFLHVLQKDSSRRVVTPANFLNRVAWDMYQDASDPAWLERGLQWAKQSVQYEDKYYNNDTYASLLYKLGRKKEALRAAKKAIEIAKKENEDSTGSVELMEKIRNL